MGLETAAQGHVSVIIPAYNAGRYLAEAIESVLAQTRPAHEIIVVDDGSTDDTGAVARAYGKRVRLMQKANGGESAARNTALEVVSGNYVLFLDADDALLPNSLQLLGGYLESHPRYGTVYSDGYYCDAKLQHIESLAERESDNSTGWVLEVLTVSSLIGPPLCAMTRMRVIHEHNLRFDPTMVIGTDWDFWIQLAAHVQFGYVDAPTCLYRIHGSNITTTTQADRRRDSILRNRLKTMESWFFDGLTEGTRTTFFFNLLVEQARFRPAVRAQVAHSPQFAALPVAVRRRLLRQAAAQALIDGEREPARDLLTAARAGGGFDAKRAAVGALAALPPAVARPVLNGWRKARGRSFTMQDKVLMSFHPAGDA